MTGPHAADDVGPYLVDVAPLEAGEHQRNPSVGLLGGLLAEFLLILEHASRVARRGGIGGAGLGEHAAVALAFLHHNLLLALLPGIELLAQDLLVVGGVDIDLAAGARRIRLADREHATAPGEGEDGAIGRECGAADPTRQDDLYRFGNRDLAWECRWRDGVPVADGLLDRLELRHRVAHCDRIISGITGLAAVRLDRGAVADVWNILAGSSG